MRLGTASPARIPVPLSPQLSSVTVVGAETPEILAASERVAAVKVLAAAILVKLPVRLEVIKGIAEGEAEVRPPEVGGNAGAGIPYEPQQKPLAVVGDLAPFGVHR